MIVDDLFESTGAWLSASEGPAIVVSSRIRLARNLRAAAYPGWAGEEECQRIFGELRAILEGLEQMQPVCSAEMSELGELERQILFERHLISR